MGAFELHDAQEIRSENSLDNKRVKEERIIAFKVYDSCRQQNCLTPAEIGPARAAEDGSIGEEPYNEGDIIRPPQNAASATVDRLKVKRIVIVDKQPSAFKNGYWDVDIKFVFEYRITFRGADATVIKPSVRANNIFNMKVCLFGSIGSDLVVGTDLMKALGDSATFDADPFVLVESKAMALHTQLHYGRRPRNQGSDTDGEGQAAPRAREVLVTIGLFSIVKIFRLVTLSVESRGFDIPDACGPLPTPVSPCAFFEEMDFPMDIFSPPQKKEFAEGRSLNIPIAKG